MNLNVPGPDGSTNGGRRSSPSERAIFALMEALIERLNRLIEALAGQAPAPRPLLDKKAVARLLAVSVRTVDTIVAEGGLTPVKVRGQIRFTPESVDAYVRSGASGKPRGGR